MRRQKGLYQRKKGGSWHAWVRVDGKPRQRKMGDVYEAALAELRRIRGRGGTASTVTVRQAARLWTSAELTVSRTSEKDRADVEARVEKYLERFLGQDHVARLTYARLAEYRLWLDARGMAPRTVHHLMGDVRSLLLYLVRTDRLDRSPFQRGLMPRVPQRIARPLLPDDARAVCAIPGELGFQCRLGIGAGFRFADLCKLDRQHFDGRAIALVAHKTGRIVRVPLEPDLADEIRVRVGRLFPRTPGSSGSFARSVRGASDVLDFGAHRMRHTFANLCRAKGLDVYRIRDLLGHKSVATTELYLSSIVEFDPAQSVTESVTG